MFWSLWNQVLKLTIQTYVFSASLAILNIKWKKYNDWITWAVSRQNFLRRKCKVVFKNTPAFHFTPFYSWERFCAWCDDFRQFTVILFYPNVLFYPNFHSILPQNPFKNLKFWFWESWTSDTWNVYPSQLI